LDSNDLDTPTCAPKSRQFLNMDSQYGLQLLMEPDQGEKHPHIPGRFVIDRIVLGGSDGAIEGVAMTAALNGAQVGFGTILLAGFAFALAGAVSMFFSSYLSRRSEVESLRADVAREKMEIDTEPEEEREELQQLLKAEGYDQHEVDVIMSRLVKNKEMWLREQLRRELRLHPEDLSADSIVRPASAGVAFFCMAMVVLSPYLLSTSHIYALGLSVSFALVALFAMGSRVFIPRNFNALAGSESAAIGALAAALMYVIGRLVFVS
jgi:vacuolar iron transporter family protein